MPTMKLVQKAVDKLQAPSESGKQILYWDGGWKKPLIGFGVLVSGTTTSRSYIVQAAVNGITRRITIGKCDLISCDEARKEAVQKLADLAKGIDPKAANRGIPVLGEALAQYLDARRDLSQNTRVSYSNLVNKHLSDWLRRPVSAITSDMVKGAPPEAWRYCGPCHSQWRDAGAPAAVEFRTGETTGSRTQPGTAAEGVA